MKMADLNNSIFLQNWQQQNWPQKQTLTKT